MKDVIYYDESSPSRLRWVADKFVGGPRNVLRYRAGDMAGCIGSHGYWVVKINYKLYYAHRLILQLHDFDIDGKVVDHINGDRTDNTLNNLRLTTVRVNARNQKKYSTNSSGIVGVSLKKTAARAYWHDNNGTQHAKEFSYGRLGLLPAISMAVSLRCEMIKKFGGYTERHGK